MAILVQKFGGSSLANGEKIRRAAGLSLSAVRQGFQVVVVVSAQGDLPDQLLTQAGELCRAPSPRELDQLLSAGEQMSAALFAMALEEFGAPAVSLTGWQAGILTGRTHQNASIQTVRPGRILAELNQGKIAVVAGFQGISAAGEVTTLGRGGSDITAVALAAALKGERCQIYTDVDGVYTADPRLVPTARRFEAIGYDDMLALAKAGAQVLHSRSVELAQKSAVEVEVLSSQTGAPGTKVVAGCPPVSAAAREERSALVEIEGLPDRPGAVFRVFSLLGAKRIEVDAIAQSPAQESRRKVAFSVGEGRMAAAQSLLESARGELGYQSLAASSGLSKITLLGECGEGIAPSLEDRGIPVLLSSQGKRRSCALVPREDSVAALEAVHRDFLTGEVPQRELPAAQS